MRTREIICEYQNYIFERPGDRQRMWGEAVSNDERTVNAWRDTWISNVRENHKRFGRFADYGIGQLFGKHRFMPIIVVGSGPSLKFNAHKLKERNGIPVVSCLHNFHFLEDNDCPADYYVSLDAGPVTIEEVSEGGKRTEAEYWDLTKERTLIAFVGSHPKLLENWQGKIHLFNAPIPDDKYKEASDAVEPFRQWVSTGGNVLGASLYIAKAYLGAGSIVFMGADFSFGYDKKFHAWDSKYDATMGVCVPAFDVFGNKVATWQSYYNFKRWFEYITLNVPGDYINCSEGGCFGSYPEGNLSSIRQMDLEDCLKMFNMCDHLKPCIENPAIEGKENQILLF